MWLNNISILLTLFHFWNLASLLSMYARNIVDVFVETKRSNTKFLQSISTQHLNSYFQLIECHKLDILRSSSCQFFHYANRFDFFARFVFLKKSHNWKFALKFRDMQCWKSLHESFFVIERTSLSLHYVDMNLYY